MEEKVTSKRILSIDTLRGADMLMIAGAGTFIFLLHGKTEYAGVDALAMQFEHPEWYGLTFYDFIFPIFLFIAGVSIPLSSNKSLQDGTSKSDIYRKALKRMIILIILGIFDKNAPVPFFDWHQIRFVGVLQRIGVAGFVATYLYLNFSSRQRIIWIAGILIFYYAIMYLVPVPGFGAGDLSFEGNLQGWFDRQFLPGRLLQKTFDENGLLTTLPAICLTIMGTLAADILMMKDKTDKFKLQWLLLTGLGCVALALVWGLHFPIFKRLWTSSFIMLTGGTAFLVLGIFYWIIDILKFQRWTFFFRVIGMNSIAVYLAYRFINFNYTSNLIFGGLYAPTPEKWHPVFESIGALVIVWLFLYTLYRFKIFLKV
ncbi:MAG: DUF5009 domain-containing protein [Chryseolinea sp.]